MSRSAFDCPTFDIADGVLWEVVDTKVMLIDRTSQELVTLNPVGSLVWQAMAEGPTSTAQLAKVLTDAFPGLDDERAIADVTAFVDELVKLGYAAEHS